MRNFWLLLAAAAWTAVALYLAAAARADEFPDGAPGFRHGAFPDVDILPTCEQYATEIQNTMSIEAALQRRVADRQPTDPTAVAEWWLIGAAQDARAFLLREALEDGCRQA